MTSRTYALASKLTRSLRNENVVVLTQASLESVTLINAKTGKAFYSVSADCIDKYGVINVAFTIKQEAGYPAPKVRTPKVVTKTHGAPKYVGVSMGSFRPEFGMGE